MREGDLNGSSSPSSSSDLVAHRYHAHRDESKQLCDTITLAAVTATLGHVQYTNGHANPYMVVIGNWCMYYVT